MNEVSVTLNIQVSKTVDGAGIHDNESVRCSGYVETREGKTAI